MGAKVADKADPRFEVSGAVGAGDAGGWAMLARSTCSVFSFLALFFLVFHTSCFETGNTRLYTGAPGGAVSGSLLPSAVGNVAQFHVFF